MHDVTSSVNKWLACSSDVWTRWFSTREEGHHEFLEVELALLNTLVIGEVPARFGPLVAESLYQRFRVRYLTNVASIRQVCTRQSSTIYCQPQRVEIASGSLLEVDHIDPTGTMLDGVPYVEVLWNDRILLEYPENLSFLLTEPS